jgi:hypothetical protein
MKGNDNMIPSLIGLAIASIALYSLSIVIFKKRDLPFIILSVKRGV